MRPHAQAMSSGERPGTHAGHPCTSANLSVSVWSGATIYDLP